MLRLGKGTVKRIETTQKYAKEIDRLYDIDRTSSSPAASDAKLCTIETTETLLQRVILHAPRMKDLSKTDDFFELGIEFLQVITISRHMKASLVKSGFEDGMVSQLFATVIYQNPTISKLAMHVFHIAHAQIADGPEPKKGDAGAAGKTRRKSAPSIPKWTLYASSRFPQCYAHKKHWLTRLLNLAQPIQKSICGFHLLPESL